MLRLGVLGCGRVFERFHLPAIDRAPTVTIVAACDADPKRLEWSARRSPRPALFSSAAELMGAGDAEALLILTPPASHADLCIQALESGLHVLVEKPMALAPADACRMHDASRRAGRRLQVGFTRRFRRPYVDLRARLQAMGRSRVRAAHFELAFSSSGWGARGDFLGDDERGGGVVDDVLSHQVDLLCWLLHATPDEVSADRVAHGEVRSALRFGHLVARCDAFHGRYADRLTLQLEDGGVLEATGSHLRSTGTAFPAFRRGRALAMDRLSLLGARLRHQPNVSLSSFVAQLRDFEQALSGGPATGTTGEEGLNGVRILEACRASARAGGRWLAPE